MKILVLEDSPKRTKWFFDVLQHYTKELRFHCKANKAIQDLKNTNFDYIFLDHDLCNEHYEIYHECQKTGKVVPHIGKHDETSGYAVAKFLSDNPNKSSNAQITIHTRNMWQGERMYELLKGRNVRVIPFHILSGVDA
jgi:hypothetical protein